MVRAFELAVELSAASVDHCTYLSDADVDALAGSGTVATLLPGVEFSTRSPYPDGRRLLDAGVRIALATDCNPGTCYSSSMPFVIALAVREMGLTPAQALRAATVGGGRVVAANGYRPAHDRFPGGSDGAGRAELPASDLPGGGAVGAGPEIRCCPKRERLTHDDILG